MTEAVVSRQRAAGAAELPAVRRRTSAWLGEVRHVWRYRAVSAAAGLAWAALGAWALLGPDSDTAAGSSSTVATAAAVSMVSGLFAVYNHGRVESRRAPAADGVADRQRRALRTQRLAAGLSLVGALAFAVVVGNNIAVFMSAGVIVGGFLVRSNARSRRAATALCAALDDLLTLEAHPGKGRGYLIERRRAVLAVARAGGSGIDSGFAVGWWGVRALHPDTGAALVALAASNQPLPPEITAVLVAHREAVAGLVDAAA